MTAHDIQSRSDLRRLGVLRGVVLCAGLGLTGAASAQTGYIVGPLGPATVPGANGAYLITNAATGSTLPTAYSRAWSSSGTAIAVVENARVAGPAGNLALTLTSSLGVRQVVAAAGRCALLLNPYCAAATAVGGLWLALRASPNADGTISVDTGTAATTGGTAWSASAGNPRCTVSTSTGYVHPTPEAAIADAASRLATSCTVVGSDRTIYSTITYSAPTYSCSTSSCNGSIAYTWVETSVFNNGQPTTTANFSATTFVNAAIGTATARCTAGTYTSGTNDCSGGSTVKMTPDQLGDYAASKATQALADKARHAGEAIMSAGEKIPASSMSSSGPATVSKGVVSTTTTTNPDGTTSTVTVVRDYELTYNGTEIGVKTKDTTTTVTKNSSGTTTGTTTSSNTTVGGPTPYATGSTSPTTTTGGSTSTATFKNQCETHPNSVGCQELGTAPTDAIPKSTSSISYTKENLGLPSGCPSPYTAAGHEFSFQPACDAMTTIRPAILVVAAVMASMICIAAIRGS